MKYFFLLSLFFVDAYSKTCKYKSILGVFPKIAGMNCTDYALMIGFAAGLGAFIFWEQVTK